jgi:DNA invertase Pin-like site-specific DNA recombinase
MAKYGYARVSSLSQSTDVQAKALQDAGCTVVRTEKISGSSRNGRDELANILDFLQSGDVLVVCKLDRLGRNTRDVLNLVHEIDQKGASLQVLEPAIDTAGAMGKMVLTVLGMVSEMELSFIKQRQAEGIAAAKARGVYKGRPQSEDYAAILQLKSQGLGVTAIAAKMGCSRGTVYKTLGES